MLDLPDKESRQRANSHGQHKAAVYQSGNYVLFVESDLSQARAINRITKKPVLCTENFEMIYDSESFTYNLKSGRYFPGLRHKALKIRDKIKKWL
jgi:hypothetical protein